MNSNYTQHKILITLILAALVFLSPDELWAQKVLFSLPYGTTQDSQIGMYIPSGQSEEEGQANGPTWFFVDDQHGNIYISESPTSVIKKYTMSGKFLLKTESVSEPPNSFCVDSEENIYLVHGALSEQLTKFNKEGKILWTKFLSEILQDVNTNYHLLGFIHIDSKNNLYLDTRLQDEIKYIKLNTDGIFGGEVPSYYFDKQGNYYVFTPSMSLGNFKTEDAIYMGDFTTGAQIDLLSSSKSFIKKFSVSLPDKFKSAEVLRDVVDWHVDPEGGVYASAFIARPISQETILQPGLIISSDNFIYKFNQQGKLISEIQFPSEPISGLGESIQTDTKGNIYYLQFYADKLDVIQVAAMISFKTCTVNSTGAYFIDGGNRNSISSNLIYDAVNKTSTGALKLMAITFNGRVTMQTTTIDEVTISGDGTVHLKGKCTVNSSTGYNFDAALKDVANPGANKDQFSITITGPNNFHVEFLNKVIAGGDIAVSWQ